MRIITVSRQFGSGGRELGKRLADRLGFDYYDKEIIDSLAEDQGLDPDYVRRELGNHGWQNVQLTFRNSFDRVVLDPGMRTQLLVKEREIIREIAEAGNDCIIVGRDADVILQDYHPFRPRAQRLSEKEILRNIRRIDKNRIRTREVLTGKHHGDASAFDLTVNTAGWEIKRLTEAVGDFALRWFEG